MFTREVSSSVVHLLDARREVRGPENRVSVETGVATRNLIPRSQWDVLIGRCDPAFGGYHSGYRACVGANTQRRLGVGLIGLEYRPFLR
jgi:hypothetical protein